MKKLKIAVIGVGNISASHIEGYLQNPNCELYAFCDIDEEKLHRKGELYGVTRLYTDCKQMLRALPELDAVSVCVWNNAHAECTIAALEEGKHVFCEKPMAMSAAQAEKMQAAAKKAGKVLGIGFVRRFGKDAELAKRLIGDGKLGEIYYAKANYVRRNGNPGGWFSDKSKSGGGPLIDLGVHVIDLVRYLAGNPRPVSVYGAAFHKLDRREVLDPRAYVVEGSNLQKDVFDVEDLAAAMIRFDNGCVLTVETSYNLNTDRDTGRVEIFGTKGGVVIDPELTFHTVTDGHLSDVRFASSTAFEGGAYSREIDDFISAIVNGTPLCSTAEDGIALMRILDAVYESARSGHEVIL